MLSDSDLWERDYLVAELAHRRLVRFAPPGQSFKLASGRESDYYIDCQPLVLSGNSMSIICRCFHLALVGADLTKLMTGRMVYTGDGASGCALVGGMLNHSGTVGIKAKGLVFHNKLDARGTGKEWEGWMPEDGDIVVAFDAVLTSGCNIKELNDKVRFHFGKQISYLLVVFDYNEGGREVLLADGIQVLHLLDAAMLREFRFQYGGELNVSQPLLS